MNKNNIPLFLLVLLALPLLLNAQSEFEMNFHEQTGKYPAYTYQDTFSIANYDSAIKIYPKIALLYIGRVKQKINKGQFKEGIADIDSAVLYANTEQKIHCFEIKETLLSYAKAKEFFNNDQIMRVYDSAISLFPYSSEVYIDRANYLSEKKMYKNAVEDFRKAIDLNPSLSYYKKLTFLMTYEAEEYTEKEILKVYDECIKHYPDTGASYIARAEFYQNKSIHFKRILNRNNIETNKQMLVYINNAIADYNKAISIEPNNWRYYLGKIGLKKESHCCSSKEILKDYTDCIETIKAKNIGYSERAFYYAKIDKYKEAITDLDTAINLGVPNYFSYLKRAKYKEYIGTYKTEEILADIAEVKILSAYNYINQEDWDEIKKLEKKYAIPLKTIK